MSESFIPTPGQTYTATVQEVATRDEGGGAPMLKVELHAFKEAGGDAVSWWARVAVPFAGGSRGAFFIPDVGDEVLVVFVNGDARTPVVVGSLWNGTDAPPDEFAGSEVDRWTVVSKAGSRIAIEEESPSSAKIVIQTPAENNVTIDDSGQSVTIEAGGSSVTIDPSGVEVDTGGQVTVNASQVTVSSGMVTVDAAMSRFSGIVSCDTLQATTVIATTYTPGAGNVW